MFFFQKKVTRQSGDQPENHVSLLIEPNLYRYLHLTVAVQKQVNEVQINALIISLLQVLTSSSHITPLSCSAG